MLGNQCAAARRWRVVNIVAARCVVEDEAVLLKEANDLARFDSPEALASPAVIPIANTIKPAVTVGGAEMWELVQDSLHVCLTVQLLM